VESFAKWLTSLQNIKHKVVIAGNHEVTFHAEFWKKNWHRYSSTCYDSNTIVNKLAGCCYYLLDSEVTLNNIRIYGSPWQPQFCDWAFNASEEVINTYWNLIPEGIDILVTHGPPKGHGGTTLSGEDVGCPKLLDAIKRTKPLVHVSGHIHEGYGVERDENTVFINASSVNYNYVATNSPIVFDIEY